MTSAALVRVPGVQELGRLQAGDTGPVKIGRTSKPVEERVAALQTGHHEPLRVLWVYDSDVEEELHEELAEYRWRGEWFDPQVIELLEGSWSG